jgi:hypothetical protein
MKPLPRPIPQKLEPLKGPFDCTINDDDLDRLWSHMKALHVSKDDRELYWVKGPSDLRGVAYTWDPKLGEKAEGLDPLVTIRTLHTWSYYGFFKPSIAEVCAAINKLPREVQDKVVAFHLTGPDDAHDLNHEIEAVDAGYHVAYATLYQKGA